MKDFMQSTNVEYKEDNKKEKEEHVENFADIQDSIQATRKKEKRHKKGR
mgnify:CR=1 FL=1